MADGGIIAGNGIDRYVVKAAGLAKRFAPAGGPPVQALDGVDVTARPGEIVALVGPNGAGKTTLLKILATLVLPDAGEAWIDGASVLAAPAAAKAKLGLLIAEDRSFYPRLTGRQNLRFFAALHGLSSDEASGRVGDLERRLRLSSLDAAFQQQSAGARQRLALARCLLPRPRLLLLDEPTRSLDPASAEAFRSSLRESVRSGELDAVVLATHQESEARGLADRVVALEAGRIRG